MAGTAQHGRSHGASEKDCQKIREEIAENDRAMAAIQAEIAMKDAEIAALQQRSRATQAKRLSEKAAKREGEAKSAPKIASADALHLEGGGGGGGAGGRAVPAD